MEDLEKKISELLSSPDSMAQLTAMARALSGNQAAHSEEAPPGQPMDTVPPPPNAAEAGGFDMPDPQMMAKLMGIMRHLSVPKDDKKTALLNALRPYLSPQRQRKLDRALQMMQMTSAAKVALHEFQGGDSLV